MNGSFPRVGLHRGLLGALLAILSTIPWLACTESDSMSELVDQYADALDDQSTAFHRCRIERRSSFIDLEARRCMVDVYMQDAANARDHLECMLPLEQELTRCLGEQFECTRDFASIEECVRPYYDQLASCAELSQAMLRELDECLA